MDICDDLFGQANHAVNPSTRAIRYIRDTWMQREHGQLNGKSMFDAIRKYGKDNPELTLDVYEADNHFCVVLVTPCHFHII